MTPFDQKLNLLQLKFNVISHSIDEFVMDSLRGREGELADIQTDQLYDGRNAKGEEIKPDYTAFTKDIKQAKGQPTDRVTLKDEGDFYQGIDYEIKKNEIEIKSSDPKTEKLKEKYGEDILGLDSQSLTKVIEISLETLADDIRTYIQK